MTSATKLLQREVDRLEADNIALQGHVKATHEAIQLLVETVETLQAENARLRDERNAIDDARRPE